MSSTYIPLCTLPTSMSVHIHYLIGTILSATLILLIFATSADTASFVSISFSCSRSLFVVGWGLRRISWWHWNNVKVSASVAKGCHSATRDNFVSISISHCCTISNISLCCTISRCLLIVGWGLRRRISWGHWNNIEVSAPVTPGSKSVTAVSSLKWRIIQFS